MLDRLCAKYLAPRIAFYIPALLNNDLTQKISYIPKACKVCGDSDFSNQELYTVKEMMFGTCDSFEYMKCSACGCLQICCAPENMGNYYPKDKYYSLACTTSANWSLKKIAKWLKSYVRNRAYRNTLFCEKNLFGLIGTRIKPELFKEPNRVTFLKGLPYDSILDVGCGKGLFLDELAEIGLANLDGIDLYIDENLTTKHGAKIQKGCIFDIKGKKYHLIMLNHSLEHMEDQQEILNHIASLLLPDGVCVIRIPVINRAWEIYGTDWFQIDAPRHFYLHTEQSLTLLAEKSGFYSYLI